MPRSKRPRSSGPPPPARDYPSSGFVTITPEMMSARTSMADQQAAASASKLAATPKKSKKLRAGGDENNGRTADAPPIHFSVLGSGPAPGVLDERLYYFLLTCSDAHAQAPSAWGDHRGTRVAVVMVKASADGAAELVALLKALNFKAYAVVKKTARSTVARHVKALKDHVKALNGHARGHADVMGKAGVLVVSADALGQLRGDSSLPPFTLVDALPAQQLDGTRWKASIEAQLRERPWRVTPQRVVLLTAPRLQPSVDARGGSNSLLLPVREDVAGVVRRRLSAARNYVQSASTAPSPTEPAEGGAAALNLAQVRTAAARRRKLDILLSEPLPWTHTRPSLGTNSSSSSSSSSSNSSPAAGGQGPRVSTKVRVRCTSVCEMRTCV